MKLLEKFYEPLTKRSNGEEFMASIVLKTLTIDKKLGTPQRKFTLTADREIRLDYGEILIRPNGELIRVISNADDFITPKGAKLKLSKAVCVQA